MKILINLTYYERPNMLRNALNSILLANQHFQDWQLQIHDDNSKTPAEPIVKEMLVDHLDKVSFDKIPDTDLVMSLADDDALHPMSLFNLNIFFTHHRYASSCYCNIIKFNPLKETFITALRSYAVDKTWKYNQLSDPICGAGLVDSSQVTWRKCKTKISTDFNDFCEKLYRESGPMYFTGFTSQFKGIHSKQRVNHPIGWMKTNDIDTKVFPKNLPNDLKKNNLFT